MYKKIFLFLILVFVNSLTYAQDKTGDYLLKCSSLAYVIQFGFPGNEKMGELLTQTQFFYDDLFKMSEGKNITQGEFSSMKSDVILSLGERYDNEINSLYELEYNCNQWRIEILKVTEKVLSDPDKIPVFPNGKILDKERFKAGKKMVNLSFKNWSDPTLNRLELSRPTPEKMKKLMFELLNKSSN